MTMLRTVTALLALTLLAIIAVVACDGPGPTPAPTATPATTATPTFEPAMESPTGPPPDDTPTPQPTATAAPQPTNTPAPTASPTPTLVPSKTPTPGLPEITLDTTWMDVINSLTAAEYDCVVDGLAEDSLVALLDMPVFSYEESLDDAEMSLVFLCLDEANARTILALGFGIILDLFMPMTSEGKECLTDWVNKTDIARLVGNDPELEDEIMVMMLQCAPDLIAEVTVEGVLEMFGLEEAVTSVERACLREWLARPDVAEVMFWGAAEPTPDQVGKWIADLVTCAPSIFIAAMADGLGWLDSNVNLRRLTPDAEACIIEWLADADIATVIAAMVRAEEGGEDELTTLARIAPGLVGCAPSLFVESPLEAPELPSPPLDATATPDPFGG